MVFASKSLHQLPRKQQSLASLSSSMSGETISGVLPHAKALAMRISHSLEVLEKKGAMGDEIMERELSDGIHALSTAIQQMEILILQEPMARRSEWKGRITAIETERTNFTNILTKCITKARNTRAEANVRSELMGEYKRPSMNAMDYIHAEQDSLRNSEQAADDSLSMGHRALTDLRRQNDFLKDAQKKLFDAGHLIGLSDSLLRMITRKDKWNAMLTYGCMIFLTLLALFFYYWRFWR